MEIMLTRHFHRAVPPDKLRLTPAPPDIIGHRRDTDRGWSATNFKGEHTMRMIAVLIAAVATVGVTAPAYAQMSGETRAQMTSMRAQNPASYDACHTLAVQRGYTTTDHEFEARSLMNFINGCMHGRR
jgi:hypothetical protein